MEFWYTSSTKKNLIRKKYFFLGEKWFWNFWFSKNIKFKGKSTKTQTKLAGALEFKSRQFWRFFVRETGRFARIAIKIRINGVLICIFHRKKSDSKKSFFSWRKMILKISIFKNIKFKGKSTKTQTKKCVCVLVDLHLNLIFFENRNFQNHFSPRIFFFESDFFWWKMYIRTPLILVFMVIH